MTLTESMNQKYTVSQGRRISEIMEEKGEAYSLRALGRRIGMSKDMLHRCVTGDRYIKPSELEQIAEGLGISVARLLMEDGEKEREELKRLLTSMKNPNRALELAKVVAEPSIGASERCEALNDLGRAYYGLREWDQAHEVWLEAYPLALHLQEKYEEPTFLHHVTSNLLLTFALRKDYYNMSEIKSKALSALETSPAHAGSICFALATIEEDRENFRAAKTYHYQALNHYEKSGIQFSIACSKHNIACFEFRMKDFKRSKALFRDALQLFPDSTIESVVTHKELSKTLIRTGHLEEARQHILTAIEQLEHCNVPSATCKNYLGKLFILLSRATNKPDHALQVAQDKSFKQKYREIACSFLIHLYEKLEEPTLILYWQKQLNELSGRKYDVIDEEDM